MMPAKKLQLNEDEIRWLLDDAFHYYQIDETIKKFGSAWTRRMLSQFLKDNPDIKAQLDQAKEDAIPYLENDLLNCHKKLDPKVASVFANNLLKYLAAHKPEKYGNRIDLNVNQTVSIKGAIENGNKRLAQVLKDVTAVVIAKEIVGKT